MTLCISTGTKQIVPKIHRLCRVCVSLYTVWQNFYDNCSNLFCKGVKIIASMESKIERARK